MIKVPETAILLFSTQTSPGKGKHIPQSNSYPASACLTQDYLRISASLPAYTSKCIPFINQSSAPSGTNPFLFPGRGHAGGRDAGTDS